MKRVIVTEWINNNIEKTNASDSTDQIYVHCPLHEDKKPSLSINIEDQVFKCHGCGESGHLSELAKLMDVPYIGTEEVVETQEYHYHDINGKLLFTLTKWRNLFQETQYKRDVTGVSQFVMYNIIAVKDAIKKGKDIIWVEGEKDVETLRSHGIVATTTPNGASGKLDITQEYFDILSQASITLMGDADEPGQKYLRRVGDILLKHGILTKIITPDLMGFQISEKGGQDISDWVQIHRDLDQLLKKAKPYEPAQDISDRDELILDDVGLAGKMAELYKHRVKNIGDSDKWFIYQNGKWELDNCEKIFTYYVKFRKYLEKLAQNSSDSRGEEIDKSIAKLRNLGKYGSLLKMLKKQPGIAITPEVFDTHEHLINFNNGTYNTNNGKIYPHNSADMITKMIEIDYIPEAKSQKWLKFLNEIFLNDQELIKFVQTYLGYCLSGDTSEQKFCMFYGTGANGKSVLINVIQYVLGAYSFTTPASTIVRKQAANGATNDLARLAGSRFVVAQESGSGSMLDEERIKMMTGGDRISARFLFNEYFSFTPQFKLALVTNNKPEIMGSDYGIWRRVLVVPFLYTVPEEKQDKQLEKTLCLDAEAILAWLVEGCKRWKKEGLYIPDKVKLETKEYREQEDVVGQFISELITIKPGKRISSSELFRRYSSWIEMMGEKPLSQKIFVQKMQEHKYVKKRISSCVSWLDMEFKE